MKLDSLKPPKGAVKNRKRVGRGVGSGHGKTAGRGEKGQKSRSGSKSRNWFEGGQMPLQRRLPKRGFNNRFKVVFQIVNVQDMSRLDGDVTPQTMKMAGLIRSLNKPVKILGDGKIDKALNVKANAFSESAQKKITQAGGSIEVI